MRLEYVDVSGFRGFRDPLRIDISPGFVVLSGRNGTGKSSICDAIEFAITGSIDKYRFKDSGTESLRDYVWYRGSGRVESHYVKVGFQGDEGPFVIERGRSGLVNTTEQDIQKRFTDTAIAPELALEELCRTSIIRDELISALSMDQKGTELFQQVSNALGGVDSVRYERKASAAQTAAERLSKEAKENHQRIRVQLEDALSDLTRVRDASLSASDIANAMKALDTIVPDLTLDLSQRLVKARAQIVERRLKLENASRYIAYAERVSVGLVRIRSTEFTAKLADARAKASALREAAATAKELAAHAVALTARQRQSNALAADLSTIIETGRRVGLVAGECPLCSTALQHDSFLHGLSHSEARLAEISTTAQQLEHELQEANASVSEVNESLDIAEKEEARLDTIVLEVNREAENVFEGFRTLGYQVDSDTMDLSGTLQQITREREWLAEAERVTRVLEASQAISVLSERESRVAGLRDEVLEAERRLVLTEKTAQQLKEISATVVRTRNEMRDELLAQIGPLLEELYQRLKPHVDWRKIEYRLRGDVRRFLSFRVGDDLNPQFIFSSGQRRAAGLAFLLSVSLSRRWSHWNTLILDDPVQHIDDYRALNLIEILSAIRRSGRQVICTAEDESLANVLCRRLRSTQDSTGTRLDFDLGLDGNPTVARRQAIAPLSDDVFRGGSVLETA